MTHGPLSGIRVLDLATMISGPLAGMMLADQGAEVIKIESPGMGDMMRHLGTQKNGVTGLYALHNRGKKSIVLNLKEDEGASLLRELISTADVLIQNFRPGAMDRLGFGYDDAARINPNLVYVSIAGFGEDGPSAKRRVSSVTKSLRIRQHKQLPLPSSLVSAAQRANTSTCPCLMLPLHLRGQTVRWMWHFSTTMSCDFPLSRQITFPSHLKTATRRCQL